PDAGGQASTLLPTASLVPPDLEVADPDVAIDDQPRRLRVRDAEVVPVDVDAAAVALEDLGRADADVRLARHADVARHEHERLADAGPHLQVVVAGAER